MKLNESDTELESADADENAPITPPTQQSSSLKDLHPSDEDDLTQYDKELADSFPASDPPAQP